MGELATWKSLLSSPWIGTLVGLASLAAALAFFLLGRRVARLAYAKDEVTVLGGAVPIVDDKDLEIRFRQRRVPRVTVARFVVWNAGNVTLRGSDMVEVDPLRLEVAESVELLHAEVLKATRLVNAFKVDRPTPAKSLSMTFDYLDSQDGAVVQLLHTGGVGDVELRGTFRGMPSGPRRSGRASLTPRQPRSLLRSAFGARRILRGLILLAGAMGAVAWAVSDLVQPNGAELTAAWWLSGLAGGVAGIGLGNVIGEYLTRRLFRRYPVTLEVD